MEKKDNTFNYLNAKLIETIYILCNSRHEEYSELINLGVIRFGIALNAKCNNVLCNKLIVVSQKCLHVSIPCSGRGGQITFQ